MNTPTKRTRHERKLARNALFWQRAAEIAVKAEAEKAYRLAHPILSGAVQMVDYVPPQWNIKAGA